MPLIKVGRQLAQIFRDEYKSRGGVESDFFEFAASDTTHLRAVAAKIRRSKPDVVFMTNYSQLGLTGRAFKELGIQIPMMTPLLEDLQIEIAKGSLEGIIFATYQDSAEDFVAKYRAKFNMAPDLGADTGYDTLYVYKDAIEQSQSVDPKILINTLLSTQRRGASGTIQFDGKGGVIKTPIFKGLQGNARVRLPE